MCCQQDFRAYNSFCQRFQRQQGFDPVKPATQQVVNGAFKYYSTKWVTRQMETKLFVSSNGNLFTHKDGFRMHVKTIEGKAFHCSYDNIGFLVFAGYFNPELFGYKEISEKELLVLYLTQ